MLNLIRILKADVNLVQALSMSLRRTLTRDVVKAVTVAKEQQLNIPLSQIEVHVVGGGNILAIVEACAALKERHIDYDIRQLMVLDLSGKDIPHFMKAFLKAQSYYTYLSLDEFVQRYSRGENVVEDALKHRFEPWRQMKSWRVRITYEGLSPDEIKTIQNSKPAGVVEVYDPNSEKWLKSDLIKL